MAKHDKVEKKAVVEQNLPTQEVRGEAKATAPQTLAEQIESVQTQLRKVRNEMAILTERRTTLEETASKLFAAASLERKREDFLKGLNEHEKELLKQSKPV